MLRVERAAAEGDALEVLEALEEGQRLAGALDQEANAKATDALEAIKVATSR